MLTRSPIFALQNLAARFLTLVAAVVFTQSALAQSAPPPYVFASSLLPQLLQMPQNSWLRVNANLYSDVWTPPDLEPLDQDGVTHTPSKIILAWSGFAWDSNRGDLIIYGGGHANYSGNDVYRWHASSLLWERASLPSDVVASPFPNFNAIDGVDNAPSAAHTYDNNIFLPIVDRFFTFGGAAYNNGGPYLRVSETNPSQSRPVGPYMFDPNRANGNKVGGTTGSHVKRVAPHPEIVGGNMWQNRDLWKYKSAPWLPARVANGCTGYAAEAGHDVVYQAAMIGVFGNQLNLFRYEIVDVANPALDQITQVGGYQVGTGGVTTCGFDPGHKLFVRTGTNAVPFLFWDLRTPGPTNFDKIVQVDSTIASFQSWLSSKGLDIQNCSLEYDPTRGTFMLWCGAGTIWELTPPASGNTTTGWTIQQKPAPVGAVPPGDTGGTGVVGKWRYAPYFDAWIGLEDINEGHIWIYKPTGWVQPNAPGNALPTVNIVTPGNGTTFAPGTPINLTANAADPGGTIARVEYYLNGQKAGTAVSAPFTLSVNPIKIGTYTVRAVAVDNQGGMTASAPITFTINAATTTVVLQRGLNGYNGIADTFLDGGSPTVNRGAFNPLYLNASLYTPLLRFAILQSEGGPLPPNAVLQSATLQVYKQFNDDTIGAHPLLKPFVEGEATWNLSRNGVPWSSPGASGGGTDYGIAPDAVVAAGYNPGWVAFDLTNRVQQWVNSSSGNNGWRLVSSATLSTNKTFNSSEYTTDTTLRPKLTLVYSLGSGGGNAPPTVSIATPANGAHITLGASFSLTANAVDGDGSVASVQYLANGAPVGSSTQGPSFGSTWTPASAGAYTLTAVATDNLGAATTSAPISVTVDPVANGTTVVLQRGLNAYAGATDTFLDPYVANTSRGAYNPLYLNAGTYTPLVRFAIFQSEGGPVPNGSTIQSATLSLYKQYYDDTIRVNALLKPWVEGQATWNVGQTGVPWSAAGAAGSGTDYASSADAVINVPYNPGWVNFDVSTRVQQWSSNIGANYGWRLASLGANPGNKTFNASEYTTNATLRPKLTIVYSAGSGGGNAPPTVSIATPANNAAIVLGASFALTANAADGDGSVASVQYFANGAPVGSSTQAPAFGSTWTPASAGSYVLTAVATDNLGASTTSAPITLTVYQNGTSVVLQRGLNNYPGGTDTFLDAYVPSTSRGAYNPLYLNSSTYTPLVRFPIFQSEGGPVPNGATILSATLSLYKQYYDDTIRLNALLKPWVEGLATWNVSQTGVPWSGAGASGAGTDYASSADAMIAVPYAPGWINFDVSNRVQQWSANAAANNGWRLASQGTNSGNKTFNSSEYAPDPTLRPKLTILYQ